MIALAESVQNSLVISGSTVAVALIGGMVTIITLLIRAGRRGKRVDHKTNELVRNHGTSIADKVDALTISVKALTDNQTVMTQRHTDNRDAIVGIKEHLHELDRRMVDYQIMSAGERATVNERLASLQNDLRLHMATASNTGELPVTPNN